MQSVAYAHGADVADVQGFRYVGRTKIHHHSFWFGRFGEKEVFAARRCRERLVQHGRFEPEIQEASTRDFDLLAQVGEVELGQHIGGELAGIEFALLGKRHEGVALVIAEFRVARADQYGGDIGVGQHREGGGLEF